MNTDITTANTELNALTETLQQRRLESVAFSLLMLAGQQDSFRQLLLRRLRDRNLMLSDTAEVPEIDVENAPIEWVPPINPMIAERKLNWLFNEISYTQGLQREKLIEILNLACVAPMPKAADWGIVFNETLGVYVAGHPFRIARRMDYSQAVILDSDWELLEPHNLAKLVNKASLMVLKKCIEAAGSDLERLEPEVGSWLWEGSEVKLYCAESVQDFENVLARVSKSGLLFASVTDEVNALALQPCVTDSFDHTLLAGLTML